MPFKSEAQNRWAHTKEGTKALGGPAAVKEWEGATDYKHLPERVGHAQGGPVDKGKRPHHQNMEHPAKPSLGGSNDGHGIFFAQGGPVLKDSTDKHYKTKDRSRLGQFLGKADRFSGGRMPAGFPQEAETEEYWSKPKGVGQAEGDDIGDCKSLKPVLPRG